MKQLQPVLWTKGVLLTPQHLQTQDRHFDDLLRFQLSSLAYAPWGFTRANVDLQALSGGTFALTDASGIFPDGLAFDLPAADSLPPPRPLAPIWEADQESLDLHLAIPEHRPGGQNVSAETGGRQTRFFAEVILLRDENTGQAEKPIQVARKNLRLLAGHESLDGYSTLRVARVRRLSTGAYELDDKHVPPLLDFSASGKLLAVARRLVEILSARSSALSGLRRQRNQGLAEFGISDVANFWLLYTINTHLPVVRHFLETRRGHPADFYRAVAALAGALTTFSTSIHPGALPEYRHDDPGPSFDSLDATVRDLLETVVPSQFASLPLKRVEGGIHATAIDQERYFLAAQWFLAVSADVGPAELIKRAPALLKVASADALERLIRQALPGLALSHVAEPPASLPIKLNYQYFFIERSGPEWAAVQSARNLAAHVPSGLPNPQLELLVVLGR